MFNGKETTYIAEYAGGVGLEGDVMWRRRDIRRAAFGVMRVKSSAAGEDI
jgi:hypothetical protein